MRRAVILAASVLLTATLAVSQTSSTAVHPAAGAGSQRSSNVPDQMSPGGPKVSDRAWAIQRSAIVIDTHEDTPQRLVDENFDLGSITPLNQGMVDLAKIHEGNLGASFFSIWVDPKKYKGEYAHRALDLIDGVYEQAKRHPDQISMAFSANDIERAHCEHKFAALLGLEGGHAIENDIRILRDDYRLGVRYMTLTWSNTNEWADSSGDIDDKSAGVFGPAGPTAEDVKTVKHHNGLTDFGKQVVLEMNRLGMMVDISHVADKTFWDTIAVTKAPLIASHSSARALASAPRNMTDDMLKAVAKNNGVVMVNFYSAFLSDEFMHAEQEQAKDRNAAVQSAIDHWKQQHPSQQVPYEVGDQVDKEWNAKLQRPAFDILINHIDHVAKVAGIDHVGLGSDFDGITSSPVGMSSVADLPKITQALLDRGYTGEQIRKILGLNLLRVFHEVERVSREMRNGTPEWSPEKQRSAPKPHGTRK